MCPKLQRNKTLFFFFGNSLAKVVGIQILYFVLRPSGNSYTMVYHEFSEAVAIDEDNLGVNAIDIIPRITGESRSGDKYSLFSSFSLQSPHEFLYFRSSYRCGLIPFLGLNIDAVQTEPVLINNSINALITTLADDPCCISLSSP